MEPPDPPLAEPDAPPVDVPAPLPIAAALLLTGPFVPMLFQEEEWAASSPFRYFTSHDDQQLGVQGVRGAAKSVRGLWMGS